MTVDELKKALLSSVLDAGITHDMIFSQFMHLMGVVESRKMTRTLKERPSGLAIWSICYPGYWYTKCHTQIFRKAEPTMSRPRAEGREYPCSKTNSVEKTSTSVERGVACKVDLKVLKAIQNLRDADDKSDHGIVQYAMDRFQAEMDSMIFNLNQSFTRGTVDAVLHHLCNMAIDVHMKTTLKNFTEMGGTREFVMSKDRVAQATASFYSKSNGSIGQLNKTTTKAFTSTLVQAFALVDSTSLNSPYDKTTSGLLDDAVKSGDGVSGKKLREDDPALVGVLIVGAKTMAALMDQSKLLKPVTLLQDAREIKVAFEPRDYVVGVSTEWILPAEEKDKDTLNRMLSQNPNVCMDQEMLKRVIRGDRVGTIKTCAAQLMTLPNGNKVVVDTVRDIYEDVNKVKNHLLEGTITLSTATVLGSVTGLPKDDAPPMKIGLTCLGEDKKKVTWITYGHAMSQLCCKKMFDNKSIEISLRKTKPQTPFPYDDRATNHYSELYTGVSPLQRLPTVNAGYGLDRNVVDHTALRDWYKASSPGWASQTSLELSPAFRFYVVDSTIERGREHPWKEIYAGKDEAVRSHTRVTGVVRGYPVHVQGNIPIAYTGVELRRGQAHQLMKVCGEKKRGDVESSLHLWKRSLNPHIYPKFFYLFETILTERYASVDTLITQLVDEVDEWSMERIIFKLADIHFSKHKLLVFPASRMVLQAWAYCTKYVEVRVHINTIFDYVAKQRDGLMEMGARLKLPGDNDDIDVLGHLSPLTDPLTPSVICVNGRRTNIHCRDMPPNNNPRGFGAYSLHNVVRPQAEDENDWNQKFDATPPRPMSLAWRELQRNDGAFNPSEKDATFDKIFLNNIFAFTGCRVHAGFVSTNVQDGDVFDWIPTAPAFWEIPVPDDVNSTVPKDKKAAEGLVVAAVAPRRKILHTALMGTRDPPLLGAPRTAQYTNAFPDYIVGMVRKRVHTNRYSGDIRKLRECFIYRRGVLFLPTLNPQFFDHGDIQCNFIALDYRCSNPEILQKLVAPNTHPSFTRGAISDSAAGLAADDRFYCKTQHQYGPMFVRSVEQLNTDLSSDPILLSYAALALNLSVDPVAFRAYADDIHPGIGFTLLKTATYSVEHALAVSKNGIMVLSDPVVEKTEKDDSSTLTVDYLQKMGIMENCAGNAAMAIPNCIVTEQISGTTMTFDYTCKLGNSTIGDTRPTFDILAASIAHMPGIRMTTQQQRMYGSVPETMVHLIPCPCNVPPTYLEESRCPIGRDLAFAYTETADVKPEHRDAATSNIMADHSIPDTSAQKCSTWNPWGSLPGCVGRVLYQDASKELGFPAGFAQFYWPKMAANRTDIRNTVDAIKGKSNLYNTVSSARFSFPNTNQLVAFPEFSYTSNEAYVAFLKGSSVPHYLINDHRSPLRDIKLSSY